MWAELTLHPGQIYALDLARSDLRGLPTDLQTYRLL